MRLDWTRDENIIIMAYYLRYRNIVGYLPKDEQQKLSEVLRAFHMVTGTQIDEKTRSLKSVRARYENFKCIDPEYEGIGLKNISQGAKQVWKQFYNSQEFLFKLSDNIEKNLITLIQNKDLKVLPDTPEEQYVFEGKLLSRIHHYRERNSKIIKLKKTMGMGHIRTITV